MAGIPPFGFVGLATQTAATRHLHARMMKLGTGRRRRKKRTPAQRLVKAAKTWARGPKKRRARRGRARLVKGSAAAKAYMAKIRRKRKK